MPNPFNAPEISVHEMARKLSADEKPTVLDVRERDELNQVALDSPQVIHVPLSQLASRRLTALPESLHNEKAEELIVMCHHGIRSAQVTVWLNSEGWTNVKSLRGGIDAYAREIDPAIGTY